MVIEYELTMEDVLALSIYHNEHSPSARRWRWIILGIFSFLGVGLLATVVSTVTEPTTKWTPMSILLSLLPLLLAMLFWIVLTTTASPVWRWQVRRTVARAYNEGKNKDLIGKRELTLTPEALIWKTPISESKTSWSAVEKIVETEQHVFIYTSAVAALVVPRRAFPDESAYREFVETARRFHKS